MEIRDSGIFDEIAKTQQTFDAAFLVTTQLGGQRLPDRPGDGYQQSGPAPQGDGRKCDHGVMVYAEGIGKNGKPYKRYNCPTKAENCPTQWGR
jgi:hypothetical protein